MSRQIQLHSVADVKDTSKKIQEVLEMLDWRRLEKSLSQQLSRDQRAKIASCALTISSLKMNIPQKRLLKEIRSFEQKAQELRNLIGGRLTQSSGHTKSLTSIEAFFFERSRKVARQPDARLELLRKGLDAVIAVAQTASSLPAGPTGITEKQWLSANGGFLRQTMKDLGLPFKIRKDTDKMHSDSQTSPFLAFYLELLKQIGRPWSSSAHALGVAIHRFRDGRGQEKVS